MRAAIIVNPVKSEVAALREQVNETMAAAGYSSSMWLETTLDDPGRGIAEAAVAAGVEVVVVCGGDGTTMACLHGPIGSDVPVALVPLGTGNLLARNLGVPIGIDDALALTSARSRQHQPAISRGSKPANVQLAERLRIRS